MELADIVLDDLRKGDPPFQKSKKILCLLEKFLQQHGDQDRHNSLEVCFIEDMITPLIHGKGNIQGPFKTFVSFLGPESIKCCQKNDAFWGTKSPFLYGEKKTC
jgi:hypothetical protein